MRPFTSLFSHVTFANVASVLALTVALSGTAYAAQLAKDSVGSKQIKNNSVKSKDLKDSQITGGDVRDGGLGGADLAADSVGGAQVNEGSLGPVPNASALGGLGAASFQRAPTSAMGSFATGSSLTLSVPGYGTFSLACNSGQTQYEVTNGLGTDPIAGVTITAAAGPLSNAVTRVFNSDGANASALYGHTDNNMTVNAVHRSANNAKAIRITAYGYSGCFGFIEAQVLR